MIQAFIGPIANLAGSWLQGKADKTAAEAKLKLTEAETKQSYWYKRPVVIIFTDGEYIIPMADDEGNDGGAMSTSDKELPTIPVI